MYVQIPNHKKPAHCLTMFQIIFCSFLVAPINQFSRVILLNQPSFTIYFEEWF